MESNKSISFAVDDPLVPVLLPLELAVQAGLA